MTKQKAKIQEGTQEILRVQKKNTKVAEYCMQCHCHSFPQCKGYLHLPTIQQHDGRMRINSILIQDYLCINFIEGNAVKRIRGEGSKQKRHGRYDVYKREMQGKRSD